MLRYNFPTNGVKFVIYKCLICGFAHQYDDTWTDEKKAEVKAEADAHHAEHIVPQDIKNTVI